ncbi:integral peroxisomal membrane peroxin-domain-containing protein [Epithele typhae]|uniref:integral peroxisomal membrane peroxin-domain-containing protein n=1 Tax=Epithele typhae TaxID=378194 RepID=UPI002008DE38|nr:integral peroxisomal membrane peroxin-domain-containing protein [Epithele typhae]KAH9913465.1 integral peroxisomal membrane peroxin-domain-containing protein [Epithele typhae]
MSKATNDELPHSAPLVEFLNTLPSPLTTTLAGLSPAIARTRHLLQILTWRASWQNCWLALALWWAVCLIPEIAVRYVLPLFVLFLFIRARLYPAPLSATPPVTEDTIQRAIADLTTIHALLPSLPSLRPTSAFLSPQAIPSPPVLIRVLALLLVPYLLLTHLIHLRVLLALAGTVVFTWRARWAALVRTALTRSAHLRWLTYRILARLTGFPLPLATRGRSPQSQADARIASATSSSKLLGKTTTSDPAQDFDGGLLPETSVRFLFTLYENQRWWMGLDWTAALLPGERPSWCSSSQQPAAPPSAFSLPAATTVYTPTPDGNPNKRVKRTARWRWEEPEWRVVVRKEGASGSVRVERPVPSAKEESVAAVGASRILKAAGKMRGGSLDASAAVAAGQGAKKEEKEGSKERESDEHRTDDDHEGDHTHGADGADEKEDEDEPCTDADGWMYADNKWEYTSSKGGMGKYTRYRRWTRVAVLTESIEIVGPGELGVQRDEPFSPSSSVSSNDSLPLVPKPVSPVLSTLPLSPRGVIENGNAPEGGSLSGHARTDSGSENTSKLAQRLKAAVKGAAGNG